MTVACFKRSHVLSMSSQPISDLFHSIKHISGTTEVNNKPGALLENDIRLYDYISPAIFSSSASLSAAGSRDS